MIQRIHMVDGARGHRASGLSAGLSAARPMCGDHPMFGLGLGRRASGTWQISVKGNQVSDKYGQVEKSTPIGARTGRAALGDPGG